MPTLNLAFIFKTTLNLVPYIETRRTTFVFFDSLEEGNFEAFNKKQRRSILGLPERSNEGQSLDFQREAMKVNPWTYNQTPRRKPIDIQP
jgi:hypothetical protein